MKSWRCALEAHQSGDLPKARLALKALGADPLEPALDGLGRLHVLPTDDAADLLQCSPDPVGGLLALEGWLDWAPDHPDTPRAVVRLLRLGGQSRHLGRQAARHPHILMPLLQDDALRVARHRQGLLEVARQTATGPMEEAMASLRRWRQAELTRVFWREAVDGVGLAETLGEVSALAEVCLQVVLERVRAMKAAATGDALDAHGQPIPMVIMGLGKLGGGELNFSSDVDVVFLYGTDDGHVASAPGERWGVHRFFIQVAREVTRWMDTATADGRLWRMDLRLRPGGDRGPLVHSLDAAEAYYEAWGRTFERAVWLKARPVAGDMALGQAVVARFEPFIYRRSLDFTAFDELRALKDRVDRHAASSMSSSLRIRAQVARQMSPSTPKTHLELFGWDMKTGRGGIREIEFVVQALQLVYGGRKPQVRGASTLAGLSALEASGLLSAQEVQALGEAYTLLRLCEHRVQMEGERQTHKMPVKVEVLERLARRMGDGPEAFCERLTQARANVGQIFTRLLAAQRPSDASRRPPEAIERLLDHPRWSMDEASFVEMLAQVGFARPKQAAGHLMVLQGRPTTPFSPSAGVKRAPLAARLLVEVLASADPDLALVHLTGFLVELGSRGSLYDMLWKAPAALRLLVGLFGSSRHLSRRFMRDPSMFEVLTGVSGWGSLGALAAGLEEGRSRQALEAELVREVMALAPVGLAAQEAPESFWDAVGLAHSSPDEVLEALRRFKNRCELRVVVADMAGLLDVPGVGQMLSALAEVCVEAVRDLVWYDLILAHGEPRDADGNLCGFCVLAQGRLGARELSYGSDLDLVFVYQGSGQTCGLRPISAQQFFSKLCRRMISWMSTQMVSGRLYEVDTRLRPSGSRGALVVTLASFERYHTERAAPWERQALLRARAIASVANLGARVNAFVRRVLYGEVPSVQAVGEICAGVDEMRGRQRAEVATVGDGVYNIKVGDGGIADVEFALQACQLVWGASEQALTSTSTFEVLGALESSGRMAAARVQALRQAYLHLRHLEGRLRMLEGTGVSLVPLGDEVRLASLARRAGYRSGEPTQALRRDLERARRVARDVFEAVVRRMEPFDAGEGDAGSGGG